MSTSHRVIATCIGLLTIGLATWLWKAEKRVWMRWLGLAALGRRDRAGNPREA